MVVLSLQHLWAPVSDLNHLKCINKTLFLQFHFMFRVCLSSYMFVSSGRPSVTMLRVHVRKAKEAMETLYARSTDI